MHIPRFSLQREGRESSVQRGTSQHVALTTHGIWRCLSGAQRSLHIMLCKHHGEKHGMARWHGTDSTGNGSLSLCYCRRA